VSRTTAPVDASLLRRAVVGIPMALLGGAALGFLAWWADALGFPWDAFIPSNFIGAWLAVAFALGASARTPLTGAARGLLGLMAAVGAYYALIALFDGGIRAIGASHAAAVWGGVGLIAGPMLGFAGAVWRHGNGRPRAIAVAFFASGLIAEGLVFGAPRLVHVDQLQYDPGALVLAGEIAIGLALPWLLLRPGERRAGYVSLIVFGIVAVVVIQPLVTLLRIVADTF
jgi:hypothetical protein